MNMARKTCLLTLGCLVVTIAAVMPVFGLTVTQQSVAAVAPPLPFSKGRLEILDIVHKTLRIQTKKESQTFRITDHTKIFHGKEALAMDRLKTGDVVAVRFALDERGDRVARIIKLDIGTDLSPLDTVGTPAPHSTETHP